MSAQWASTGVESAYLRDVGWKGGGGMAGEDRYSAGANQPFLAQICHCPVVVWGLPALVASQRTANFLPSRGGKPSVVFGLIGVAVFWRILPTQGRGPPVGPADRVKATLLAVTPPGRLKSYFPLSIHT